MKKPTSFKLVSTQHNEEGKIFHVTFRADLSFSEAKAIRKENRGLTIVPVW